MSREAAAVTGGSGGNADYAGSLTSEELANIENLTNSQLGTRLSMLQREIHQLKNEERSKLAELQRLKNEVESDKKRVKDNNKLPYLVASISEILDLEDDDDEVEELDVGKKKVKAKAKERHFKNIKPARRIPACCRTC